MSRPHTFLAFLAGALLAATPGLAQIKPEVIERGKRATALVEVITEKGQATGSAFCIDASGLFVTNAHVIAGSGTGERIQLVLDIGKKSQRSLRATPRWVDDELDVALLKAEPRGTPLTALDLGKDGDLSEGAEVTTFGFPFGQQMALERNAYPEVSVNLSRVTTVRKEKGRLATIKFDGQLNPGNSGGPVLGLGGQVVGIAVATVLGRGINFAIPVGLLTERLGRPGLQVQLPPLAYSERSRSVTWTFKPVAPWPSGKLPEGLSVVVTLTPDIGEPRVIIAQPSGTDGYRATFTPMPRNRTRMVRLYVQTDDNPQHSVYTEVKDCDVTVGKRRFMLGDVRTLFFNPGFNQGPYVILAQPAKIDGPIKGLGTVTEARQTELFLVRWGDVVPQRGNVIGVGLDNGGLLHIRAYDEKARLFADTDETKLPRTKAGAVAALKQKLPALMPPHPLSDAQKAQILADVASLIGQPRPHKMDLTRTTKVDVQGYVDGVPPVRIIDATAELRSGATTHATAHKVLDFSIAPAITAVTVGGDFIVIRPPGFNAQKTQEQVNDDDGMVTIGGTLDTDGTPRGAGASVRPARLLTAPPGGAFVRTLEGRISDLAVGGGGRYLILVLKDARKLAVFDVNAADVVKTVSLPTNNVLVAAGARKFVVAYPDEKLIQRWDLEQLTSDSGPRSSPINGQLRALALGSDSDGPILAAWQVMGPPHGNGGFSFIGLDSLEVLRVGPTTGARCEVSPSRGTFLWRNAMGTMEIRASSGGNLFGFDSTGLFATVSVQNGKLNCYSEITNLPAFGYVCPGPDSVSVFTGLLGRLDAFGKTVGTPDPALMTHLDRSRPWLVGTLPSASPSYFLILGPRTLANYGDPGPPSVSVHAAGDGTRLLTVSPLAEMTLPADTSRNPRTLGSDQRYYFLPDAGLLITVPPSNDRLVLRRVDVDAAVRQANDIVVLSPPLIDAVAGLPLQARVVARSGGGDVRFALVQGPKGLSLSPDGEISWPAPELPEGVPAKVALSLRDPSGRSRSHEVLIRLH
jgi:hypothetical protein